MRLEKIRIQNYRLLHNVELNIDKGLTLVVGRNNSGKTSLFSLLLAIFSGDKINKLSFSDFSLLNIKKLKAIKSLETEIEVPIITVEIIIDYSEVVDNYPPSLQPFIIDLDEEIKHIKIVLDFKIDGKARENDFKNELLELNIDSNSTATKYDFLVKKYFNWIVYTEDPTNTSNKQIITQPELFNLIRSSFLSAQRFLQDQETVRANSIGEVMRKIVTSLPESNVIKSGFEKSILQIQSDLTNVSNKFVEEIKGKIGCFGSDDIEEISAEMVIDPDKILPFLQMSYLHDEGVNFPEHFNGLGRRNLLLISMKLVEAAYLYKYAQTRAPLNFIFIEEPEAFFHPQMQEVFIKNLLEFKVNIERQILGTVGEWKIQFIISTHSSHIANQEDFNKIRYFKKDKDLKNTVQIKDLSEFNDQENADFLKRYLTLTRCDLFFADKAILYEGMAERLIMPRVLNIYKKDNPNSKLHSQYVTLIEVGGAYAHKFFSFLKWLGLPTLIVTDLDSVKEVKARDKNGVMRTNLNKCMVSEGKTTSNSCISSWFKSHSGKLTVNKLLNMPNKQKKQENLLLAYQIYEDKRGLKVCGRSFEEAFILANLELFPDIYKQDSDASDIEKNLWEKYGNLKSSEKTAFAFEYTFENINWIIPRYIKEGLSFLEKEEP